MPANKAPKAPPVPHQRRGVALPKHNLYARQQEVLRKENRFTIEMFRQRAANSMNPVFRASQLGIPLSAALTSSVKQSGEEIPVENLVDGNSGVLLSRGSLPSGVLANYSRVPSVAEWRLAEKKSRDLKMELEALDTEIAERDKALKLKIQESLMESTSPEPSKATASCYAPAFTWEMNRTLSTTHSDFVNHDKNEYKPLYEISRTQYGDMSRFCDYLGPKDKAQRKTRPGSRR